MPTPLIDKLSHNLNLTDYMVSAWNLAMPYIFTQTAIEQKEVSPSVAKKYKFDFDGLLINEFNVPRELLYPHYLVNSYNTSTDYTGDKLVIYLLAPQQLLHYKNKIFKLKK